MLLKVFPAVAVLTIFQRLQSFCHVGWLPSLSLGCCFFEVRDKVPRSGVILESQASREFELQLSLSSGLARVEFLLPFLSLCLNSCSLQFSSDFIVFPSLVLLSLPAACRSLPFSKVLALAPCGTSPTLARPKLPRPLCNKVGVQPLKCSYKVLPDGVLSL